MAKKGHVKIFLDVIDKDLRKGLSGASRMISGFGRSVVSMKGLLASAGLAYGLKKLTDAANEQIAAETKLLSSFKARGGISKEAAQGLQSYAAELQKVTRFGDENIIRAQAMLGSFNVSTESVKKLTMGMLDMSEASSKDANGMQDLTGIALTLGKALDGQVGMMSRYGIVMSDAQKQAMKLGDEEERVAVLAKVLEQNFGGAAVAMGKTFAGAQQLVKNNFGDMLEEMGKVIATSGPFRTAMVGLANIFGKITKYMQENAEDIGDAIKSAFEMSLRSIEFFIRGMGQAAVSLHSFRSLWGKMQVLIYKGFKAIPGGAEFVQKTEGQDVDVTIRAINDVIKEQARKAAQAADKTNTWAEAIKKLRVEIRNTKPLLGDFISPTGGGGGGDTGGGSGSGSGKADMSQYQTWGAQGIGAGGIGQPPIGGQVDFAKVDTSSGGSRLQEQSEFAKQMTENMSAYREQASAAYIVTNMIGSSVAAIGDTIATALVDGTANWSDMFKQLLKQLIAMTVQALIFKAVMGSATGGIGFLFHTGGVVGRGGKLRRYHTGGIKTENDEVPIIGQRGEAIINRYAMRRPGVAQAAAMLNRGIVPNGNSGSVYAPSTNIYISALDGADVARITRNRIIPEIENQFRRNAVNFA